MTYAVVQTRRVARAYKKSHDNLACALDVAVATLATSSVNPAG